MTTVAGEVRDHAMDGIAHGHDQDHLIFNSSPEMDSILEQLGGLDTISMENRRYTEPIRSLLRKLLTSNAAERDHERAIAGAADSLDCSAHQPLGSKGIARRLAPLVDAVRDNRLSEAGRTRATAQLLHAVRLLPATRVLRPAVAHELGGARYRLLEQLLGDRS